MLGETVFAKEKLNFNPHDKSQFVEIGRRGTRVDNGNAYSMKVQFDGLSTPITVGRDQIETAPEAVDRLQAENKQLWAFVKDVRNNAPVDEQQPEELWRWLMWEAGIKARALLASLQQPESE